ncbi:hypothetical protein O5552_10790 [Escherichia coli]|nr:hypothetical protein [Escherichia coli]
MIYSARKRSDCVSDVLFARSVDPFPSGFVVFKNIYAVVVCFTLRVGLFFFFVGDSFCFNQEPLALLNGGMP